MHEPPAGQITRTAERPCSRLSRGLPRNCSRDLPGWSMHPERRTTPDRQDLMRETHRCRPIVACSTNLGSRARWRDREEEKEEISQLPFPAGPALQNRHAPGRDPHPSRFNSARCAGGVRVTRVSNGRPVGPGAWRQRCRWAGRNALRGSIWPWNSGCPMERYMPLAICREPFASRRWSSARPHRTRLQIEAAA